jgi:hypothetical protein
MVDWKYNKVIAGLSIVCAFLIPASGRGKACPARSPTDEELVLGENYSFIARSRVLELQGPGS